MTFKTRVSVIGSHLASTPCSLMIFLSITSQQLKIKINISHINFFVNAK